MLSCSIGFSAPSFWMGGGLESRCIGRVYGAECAVRVASSWHFTLFHTNIFGFLTNLKVTSLMIATAIETSW